MTLGRAIAIVLDQGILGDAGLVLCRSGLCLKPVTAILITLGNSKIPLTLLMTHRLPGYREQQQRSMTVE